MKKIVFGLLLFTAACASTTTKTQIETAEELYNQAYAEMEQTAWQKAALTFEKIEVEHPYSKLAAKAKLMSA